MPYRYKTIQTICDLEYNSDVKKLKQNRSYDYKSYSEVLTLSAITLLKDILMAQSNHSNNSFISI